MTTTLLQYVGYEKSLVDAVTVLSALATQVDYVGGRVIPPSASKPTYRAQAFFLDAPGDWFPDGIRRVVVPDGVRTSLGIAPPCPSCGGFMSAPSKATMTAPGAAYGKGVAVRGCTACEHVEVLT